MINPRKFDSVQQYLEALGFLENSDFYVKGKVKFPVVEIIKHTPTTFAQKMKERGWMEAAEKKEELATPNGYQWSMVFLNGVPRVGFLHKKGSS